MTIAPARVPESPRENDPAVSARESLETLSLMAGRRSTKFAFLTAPGPSPTEIDTLIRLAARAPDHGKLGPWRFVVFEGEGRARAGEAIASVIAGDDGVTADRIAFEKKRFMTAPVCVMVVSATHTPHKIPEWEQQLSAGAVCYGLLIAAHAMGYAGTWLTEWVTYDERARAALGLSAHERIAGLVFVGTASAPAIERARPDLPSRVTRF